MRRWPRRPTVTLAENGSLLITLAAADADGDTLGYSIPPTDVQHGTLSAIDPTTHQLTYTPDANYNGPDSFIFKVDDGKTGVSSAQITLNVTPVNTAPAVLNQSANVNENGSLNLLLDATDVEDRARQPQLRTRHRPAARQHHPGCRRRLGLHADRRLHRRRQLHLARQGRWVDPDGTAGNVGDLGHGHLQPHGRQRQRSARQCAGGRSTGP